MGNGNVIYVNFRDSSEPLSILSCLKIEISQIVLGVIREYCDKKEIERIGASLEMQIHREYLFPIVDRIDDFNEEDTLSFQKQIREELIFIRARILRTLEGEKQD